MTNRERDFCRIMTLYADPLRAAKEAGYQKPATSWQNLMVREDIADEIRRISKNIGSIYESTAVCGMYRLAYGDIGDALTLMLSENPSKEDIRELDLRCIAEIKRIKDKGIEMKFCDRIKAISQLSEILGKTSDGSGSSLLEAMVMSAQALKAGRVTEDDI